MKTIKFNVPLLLFSLILLTGCKNEGNETETTTATQTEAGTTPNTASNDLEVNPAHGLPGHRCDIPVGAPLTSNTSTTTPTQTSQTSSGVSPIRVDQTPKINPPHGEPGHDCAVPVGGELK